METLTPTAEQARALALNRDELRKYWLGRTMPTVARRWVWWSTVTEMAQSYNVDPAVVVGRDLARLNDRLNADAAELATVMVALGTGQARVQPWTTPGEGAPVLHMGIARKGGELGALPALLIGAWALAPTLVSFAVRAVVGAGMFIIGDAWLAARKAEAEAAAALEGTRQRAVEAIAQASARSPQAGAALSDALSQADLLSGRQDALDKLLDSLAGLTDTFTDTGGGALPWLAAFWFFTQRKAS